ncbi:MAG: 30S ribosomal protein S6 [Bacteroidota bacterium]|nr:30S ribosomal protein S6 [Candidatus Kapabacteria bacterium]MDW8220223.1 30S ribosomal protein S6 [Bacteroidota bacterium]
MNTAKRTYETTFIVNASLEDATIEHIITSTIEFIKNNGGVITTLDKWGRRRLAYPIQKKHNGFYVYVMYDAPATLLPQLERYFHLEENILRHLTLKMSKHALEFRKAFLQNRHERMMDIQSSASEQAASEAIQEASAIPVPQEREAPETAF